MDKNLLINIGSWLTTVAAFIYAIIQSRINKRLIEFGKTTLDTIKLNINKTRENPSHADTTFKNIQEHALLLDKNEHVNEILKNAQSGARDVAATERILEVIENDIDAFKKGFFYLKKGK